MTTNTRRPILGLALVSATLTIAVAGCSAQDTTTNAASSATPPAAPTASPPAAAASPLTTVPPSSAPATTESAKKPGCPVDPGTLEKAFKANASLASDLILGKGLTGVVCYQNYATATTMPDQADPATVVFAYNASTSTWAALTGGTDVNCADDVPAKVIPHLPSCHAE